jgi:hypothetical protein
MIPAFPRAGRERLMMAQAQAAERLGVSLRMRTARLPIPPNIALACRALECGLTPNP